MLWERGPVIVMVVLARKGDSEEWEERWPSNCYFFLCRERERERREVGGGGLQRSVGIVDWPAAG